jgi:hypothetical protein
MKKLTAALCLGAMVGLGPVVARADDNTPDVLDTSAAARSGAERMGGVNVTAPPHASKATGQESTSFSTSDTKKETPRNPAVNGPTGAAPSGPPAPNPAPITYPPPIENQ